MIELIFLFLVASCVVSFAICLSHASPMTQNDFEKQAFATGFLGACFTITIILVCFYHIFESECQSDSDVADCKGVIEFVPEEQDNGQS